MAFKHRKLKGLQRVLNLSSDNLHVAYTAYELVTLQLMLGDPCRRIDYANTSSAGVISFLLSHILPVCVI